MRLDDTVCAVVPVYNAAGTLRTLVTKLEDVLRAFKDYRIVLVDDSSADKSFEIVRELCDCNERITGVRLRENSGQQSAVLCGLRFSDCDYAVTIDDDLEQDPADILRLYDEIKKGYDCVYGIGPANMKGAFRGLGSKLRDRLFDRITDLPKGVKVGSFRIMNAETVGKILRADTRFVYISLEMLKYTNRIGNIAVGARAAAPSGYRAGRLARLLARMVVYYAPGRLWERRRVKGSCYEIAEIINA